MKLALEHELNGVIIVDKPVDITSARVTAFVKKMTKAQKAGHTGTLDPFATGVLVCCINHATRLARFLLKDNKKYDAVLQLGVATDTQDSTGTIISTCEKIQFSEETIRSVLKQFEGEIDQLPPVYSALKHKGAPLYKLARMGKPVQKPARSVFISNIDILEINLPVIRFEVACSSGTYIRTLCADIGALLGCGGHLKELRRLESGGFTIKDAVTLPKLEELASSGKISDRMISMTNALPDMPEYTADPFLAKKLMDGKTIKTDDFMPGSINIHQGLVKIIDINNELLAILNHNKDNNKWNYCCVFPQ